MSVPRPPRPVSASSRLRVLEAVRRGVRTVNDLAAELGVTDNAVRGHLAALGRDGLLRSVSVVRSGVAGKPAAEYEVTPVAEVTMSRAYAPALEALVQALASRLDTRTLRAAFRDAGRRLAPGTARSGSLALCASAARDLLNDLGGSVEVELSRTHADLRSAGCPLAEAVARVPETCTMVEAMLEAHCGRRAEQRCAHGARPRCAFRLT